MVSRRLTLTSSAQDAVKLNAWLDGAAVEMGLADELAAAIKLCLNEAFANVVSYAFDGIDQPEIYVDLEGGEGRVTAILIDNGWPFNPLSQGTRAKSTPHTDGEIGGFGIQLIRETANKVTYQRADGRNWLSMTCQHFDKNSAGKGSNGEGFGV